VVSELAPEASAGRCIAVVVFDWLFWVVPLFPFLIAFLLLLVAFRIIAVNRLPRSIAYRIGVVFSRSLSCGVFFSALFFALVLIALEK
jgi:hypothetical protein